MIPRQIVIRSKEYQKELLEELKCLRATVLNSTPSTLWVQEDKFEPAWADCVWRNVKSLQFESITDAQKKLKVISKQWRYYGDLFNRRGALIAEKLSSVKKAENFCFPGVLPLASVPAFTLADPHLILYSHEVTRPTVDGVIPFQENKQIPPSRAYLKLWEALTILGEWPKKGDWVLDLGSSPGSWSWALSELHAHVLSIDRSALNEKIVRNKNIEFKRGDAFSFKPVKMDWVFSDVICFPDKLLEYVQTWIRSGYCNQFVCNVKLTGEVDPFMIEQFKKLPHSRVLHLLNGKKELTWLCHPKLP